MSMFLEDLEEIDDELEKQEKRKARLKRPNNEHTTSTTENNSQYTVNYDFKNVFGNCMRMAAEGKINHKNAFNMKLIDCLKDMLSGNHIHNFQVASSSLDAGTKIYAGRVDAVHQETYHVLTGLGKKSKKPEDPEQENEDVTGEIDEPRGLEASSQIEKAKKKEDAKRRAQARKNIICKNLSKIRIKSEISRGYIDPAFTHQAAAYDEGGPYQLRLNQTDVCSDACELFLDSEMPVFFQGIQLSDEQRALRELQLNIGAPSLSSLITTKKLTKSLNTFRLNENNDDILNELLNPYIGEDDHKLQDSSLLENDTLIAPDLLSDNENDYNDIVDDFNNDNVEDIFAESKKEDIALDNEIKRFEKQLTISHNAAEFVDGLRNMLAEKMEIFGDNHADLLGLWAGPDHWKTKIRRENQRKLETVSTKKCEKVKVKKLEYPPVDKNKEEEMKENLTRSLKVNRVETNKLRIASEKKQTLLMLNSKTLEKNSQKSFTLPDEYFSSRFNLLEQEISPISTLGFRISDQILNSLEDMERLQNEVHNITDCPNDFGIDDDEDACQFNLVNDLEEAMELPVNQEEALAFSLMNSNHFPPLTQETENLDLLSQPYQVAKVSVAYAKTAKSINVKLLKYRMWETLMNLPEEKPEFLKPDAQKDYLKLSEFFIMLPNVLDERTSHQLSVPIMLNCLLHLANEKNLYLQCVEDGPKVDLLVQRFIDPIMEKELKDFAKKTSSRPPSAKRQTRIDDWMVDHEASALS